MTAHIVRSRALPEEPPRRLTIAFDDRCIFCWRCRDWLLTQPCLVNVELIPASSRTAKDRFDDLPGLAEQLVVGDERGRIWVGGPAFVMCLWATIRYRPWAFRLAQPRYAPAAERFFRFVSTRRHRLGGWLHHYDPTCSACHQGTLAVDGVGRT
ncbi:MAG: DCC1-like thiol-disulfide oxidoreductase family protein [Actinomycetota bacterium]